MRFQTCSRGTSPRSLPLPWPAPTLCFVGRLPAWAEGTKSPLQHWLPGADPALHLRYQQMALLQLRPGHLHAAQVAEAAEEKRALSPLSPSSLSPSSLSLSPSSLSLSLPPPPPSTHTQRYTMGIVWGLPNAWEPTHPPQPWHSLPLIITTAFIHLFLSPTSIYRAVTSRPIPGTQW